MAAPKRPTKQARALLDWEIACERLHMVLTPPRKGATAGLLNLEQAVALAHAALDEIREAFRNDAGSVGSPHRAP